LESFSLFQRMQIAGGTMHVDSSPEPPSPGAAREFFLWNARRAAESEMFCRLPARRPFSPVRNPADSNPETFQAAHVRIGGLNTRLDEYRPFRGHRALPDSRRNFQVV
jgi:hypothetical protein